MKRFVLGLLFAVAGAAHAQSGGSYLTSEYFHQAEGRTFELTPGIGQAPGKSSLNTIPMGYRFTQTTYKTSSAKYNTTSLPIVADFEYGLTPMFSIGAQLAYASLKVSVDGCPTGVTCTGSSAKGLADPQVFAKGRAALPVGQLHYGLSLNVPVMEAWSDGNSHESSVTSGGFAYVPFVGYEMQAGFGVWGARVVYALWGERSVKDRDQNNTDHYRGGNDFTLETFYEFPISGNTTIGFAAQYLKSSSTENKNAAGAWTDNKDATSTFALKAYAPMPMESFTLLPSLSYSSTKSDESTTSDKMTGFELGLAARIVF